MCPLQLQAALATREPCSDNLAASHSQRLEDELAGNICIRRNRTGGRGGRGWERRRRAEQSKMHDKKAEDASESVRSPGAEGSQRAMMPGPGEVSQTGGAHWRCEPRSFGACAHGINCVCHGRPSGSQVRAGEQQGTWRYRGFHQDAGPTIPRKSILPSERLSLRTAPSLGQPCFTLAWPGKSLVLKFA